MEKEGLVRMMNFFKKKRLKVGTTITDKHSQINKWLRENHPKVKVLSAEFYFHKPITVHLELYLFYRFIHFLLYIGQY